MKGGNSINEKSRELWGEKFTLSTLYMENSLNLNFYLFRIHKNLIDFLYVLNF